MVSGSKVRVELLPYRNMAFAEFNAIKGVYEFTGLDYWTGLLDWTTGLIKNVVFFC